MEISSPSFVCKGCQSESLCNMCLRKSRYLKFRRARPQCVVLHTLVLMYSCLHVKPRLHAWHSHGQSRNHFAFSSLSDQWETRLFFIFRNTFLYKITASFTHGDIYNPDRGQGHDRPFQTSPRMARGRFSARGPYATGLEWPIMPPPEVWIVVSTCTTQNSCLRFVIFHDDEGKLMEWAILEHSWLHQQSWLTSTAEAQELMISSASLGNFPTLFRGQVPAHRIDFFFDVEDCRHSGSLGTCACGLLVLLGSFAALRGRTHACWTLFGIAIWTLNPLCSFVSLISLSFDLYPMPSLHHMVPAFS